MYLDEQQQRWMDGEEGPSLQWAMKFNHDLGTFFKAEKMIPVASAHFAPDTRLGGGAMRRLLETLVADCAKVSIPSYLDQYPCQKIKSGGNILLDPMKGQVHHLSVRSRQWVKLSGLRE